MPKLSLRFEGRVLKEYVVGTSATIGRLPDNTIVIDNPAVSGHHARFVRDGEAMILEDLNSTNGTFVNAQLITRHPLQDGDVVLIGKHKLVFERLPGEEPVAAEPALSGLGDTVYLDTKLHKALMASLQNVRPAAAPPTPPRATVRAAVAAPAPAMKEPAAPPPAAVLRVVDGPAEHIEYALDGQTSLIGKSVTALVRLHGWFKPDVAVAIARNGSGYVATRLAGRTRINGRPLDGRHSLKEGDILYVNGLTLTFHLKNGHEAPAAAAVEAADASRLMSAGERAATFRAFT